ncbi:MAG: rRNA maturation RNase YbeY [Acholeplasmataceae bacterium]|nr:rRNA maturation RNase YbeY [Acholeplasmataceae bacterium]
MIKIEFYNQTTEDTQAQETLIRSIFDKVEGETEFNVIFVTNSQIKEINKTYRQVDSVTDVISFPDDEDASYIGDIFISLERAQEQAAEYGHSFDREVGFLSVHGYLHLNGYDHHTVEDEKIMIEKQESILKNANLERIK